MITNSIIDSKQLFEALQIQQALFQKIKNDSLQLLKEIEENPISKEEIQLKIQKIFHLSDAGHNLPLALQLVFFDSSRFIPEYFHQDIQEAKKNLHL